MADVRFERVTALPSVSARKSGTAYLVADPDHSDLMEIYVTGKTPSAIRRVPTLADITSIVSAASGSSYDFVQSSAASTWTVNHNLGRKPVVAVFTVGGVEVDAEIVHVSNNQTQINFASAMAGSATFS